MPTRTSPDSPTDAGHALRRGGMRFVKFNPEINTGTIIQIGAIVLTAIYGVGAFNARLDAQAALIETNRLTAATANTAAVDSLKELKTDMREVQKSMNDIKESVAILRGRAADNADRRTSR